MLVNAAQSTSRKSSWFCQGSRLWHFAHVLWLLQVHVVITSGPKCVLQTDSHISCDSRWPFQADARQTIGLVIEWMEGVGLIVLHWLPIFPRGWCHEWLACQIVLASGGWEVCLGLTTLSADVTPGWLVRLTQECAAVTRVGRGDPLSCWAIWEQLALD